MEEVSNLFSLLWLSKYFLLNLCTKEVISLYSLANTSLEMLYRSLIEWSSCHKYVLHVYCSVLSVDKNYVNQMNKTFFL